MMVWVSEAQILDVICTIASREDIAGFGSGFESESDCLTGVLTTAFLLCHVSPFFNYWVRGNG